MSDNGLESDIIDRITDESGHIIQLDRKQRAQVRQRFRSLIEDAEDSTTISTTLQTTDTLFKNVRNADDATLDSKILTTLPERRKNE